MNTDNKENQEEKKMNGQEQKPKIYVIDTGKIKQTKAFARQDGTILGTVWVISFVCTMLAVEPKYHILGLLSNLLIVATPFIVAKRLRIFRDQVRGGHISFRHGLYLHPDILLCHPLAHHHAIPVVPLHGHRHVHEPAPGKLSDIGTGLPADG